MRGKRVGMLALAGALTVASQAGADPWGVGNCFIQCPDGTTARLWSTAAECCAEFQNLCGGNGIAYMTFGWPPQIYDLDCSITP